MAKTIAVAPRKLTAIGLNGNCLSEAALQELEELLPSILYESLGSMSDNDDDASDDE